MIVHKSKEYDIYFDKLKSFFDNEEALLKLVLYLKGIKLDKFVPASDRVITKFYSSLKSVNISSFYRWFTSYISEFVTDDDDLGKKTIEEPSMSLYKIYETYISRP